MSLPTCTKCQTPMRPKGVPQETYPGTKTTGSRGYCGACYELLRRDGHFSGKPRVKPRKVAARVSHQPAVTGEAREVLTRVYLTSSTYKTLKSAKVDTAAVLSRVADRIAAEVNRRA